MDDKGLRVSRSLIGACIYRRTGSKQKVVDVLVAVLTPDPNNHVSVVAHRRLNVATRGACSVLCTQTSSQSRSVFHWWPCDDCTFSVPPAIAVSYTH